jgi:hypothetical protein
MVKVRFAAVALVAMTILSGCAAKSEPTTNTLDQAAKELDVQATATTGVIRGIVVDDAVRPLGGVTMTLASQGRLLTANSTVNGAFGFQGLPEGTYFVKAHKAGYLDAQTSSDVKAGISDPPITKIGLVADRSYTQPYVLVMSSKGFIECGTDVVALCAVPNHMCLPLVVLQPCLAYGPDNVTNDNFSTFFPLDAEPRWIQAELVWKSTQALGDKLSVTSRVSNRENYAQGFYLRGMNSSVGPSPLLVIDDYDLIHNTKNGGKDALGVNGTGLELDIFSGGNVPTPVTRDIVGVQVQQEYQIIVHAFYGYRPPSGYRFTSDGDPPAPV